MAKKKRSAGRPRNAHKTAPKALNYHEKTIQTLAALTEKFRMEAPPWIRMSDRAVIEALIHYADRENLSFSDLFQLPEAAAK